MTKNYGVIRSAEQLSKLVDQMIAKGLPIGLDIESGYTGDDKEKTSLLPYHPEWIMVGISFTNDPSWARYVPFNHDDPESNIDDKISAARAIWRMLNSGLAVAHHAHFEENGIARFFREMLCDDEEVGEEVRKSNGFHSYLSDTMLEVFYLAEYAPVTAGGPGLGLKALTKTVFGHQMTEFMDLFEDVPKNKRKYVRFNDRELTDQVIEYACEDSAWCLALHQEHYDKVKDQVMFKTDIALIPILSQMEYEGLLLDWDAIHEKTVEIQSFMERLNEEIQEELSERTGTVANVNLSSPKQVADMLYTTLGLPVNERLRSEKSGAPSTSEKALRGLAQIDRTVAKILKYREVKKLHGSYLKKYDTELNYGGTGRAYPSHNQVGALTGRFSVDGVSYQQWPKEKPYELKDGTRFSVNFRSFFIPPEGYRIIGFDFSQVELRILSGMSQEQKMIEAFTSGVDIHKATASNMMKVPLDEVTKKQRSAGKTLNFAVVYGSGPANIAEMLSTPADPVTKEDAEDLLSKYYDGFPSLRGWMDSMVAEGRKSGCVKTPFGAKFTVWEYTSPNEYIRSKGDRMCVNAPVQGGAANYIKIGMVRADKAIRKAGLQDKIRMVMTVHDAIEFYVHESVTTQQVIDLLDPMFSFPLKGYPEILAEWHECRNWGEVVEIKTDEQKQITHFEIDDVDVEFQTVEDAYAYFAAPPSESDKEPEGAAGDIEITMLSMPTKAQWGKFQAFLAERPGEQSLLIHTPQGTLNGISKKYEIRKDEYAMISNILGGAEVMEIQQDADLDDLLDDLEA